MDDVEGTASELILPTCEYINAELMVPQNETGLRAAIRFVFNFYAVEYGSDAKSLDTRHRILFYTTEDISYRYDLLMKYAPYFFEDDFNEDALNLAVIGGARLREIDSIDDMHLGNLTGSLTQEMLDDAKRIQSQADLLERVNPPANASFEEAIFLAHVNALEDIRTLNLDFENLDEAALQERMLMNIGNIAHFLCQETEIGQELIIRMGELEQRIVAHFQAESPAAIPQRPNLHLIPPPEPN